MTYVIAVICAVLILGFDQYTKYLVITNYSLSDSVNLIPGVIDLTYIHNKGGAWGLMFGYTWILISLTIIIMVVCVSLLIKNGFKSKTLFWSILLILSGGLGNMCDRIFRGGSVVDFLHLSFWPSFPVFNVADSSIVVGACLLLLYFLLDIYKDYRDKKSLADISNDSIQSDD